MVLVVIGILSVMALPAYLSYRQAAILKSGAQQLAAMINQAREIAIKENCKVSVTLANSTQMTYVRSNTCTVTGAWVGVGTDAAGNINLPAGITATATAQPIFNYLGSLDPPSVAVYTLTNTQTSATLTVSVVASGRVSIP